MTNAGKKAASLIIAFAMAVTSFACLAPPQKAEAAAVDLSKANIYVKADKSICTYTGDQTGPNQYSVFCRKGEKYVDITKKVSLSQTKHTECGEWFVKVTAKSGSGYIGSKMCRAYVIIPGDLKILKVSYSKKSKKTTVKIKLPAMNGNYSYVLYKGAYIDDMDEDFLTKSQKKRILKKGKSKSRKWKNGQVVIFKVKKRLKKGTYRLYVENNVKAYTNCSGKAVYDKSLICGGIPQTKKFIVK